MFHKLVFRICTCLARCSPNVSALPCQPPWTAYRTLVMQHGTERWIPLTIPVCSNVEQEFSLPSCREQRPTCEPIKTSFLCLPLCNIPWGEKLCWLYKVHFSLVTSRLTYNHAVCLVHSMLFTVNLRMNRTPQHDVIITLVIQSKTRIHKYHNIIKCHNKRRLSLLSCVHQASLIITTAFTYCCTTLLQWSHSIMNYSSGDLGTRQWMIWVSSALWPMWFTDNHLQNILYTVWLRKLYRGLERIFVQDKKI